MLWLTWRQHRVQLTCVAAVLAIYCGYLAYGGLQARDALAGCPSFTDEAPVPRSCFEAANNVNDTFNSISEILLLGNLLPLVVGMFWGAPLLARELEQGTYRLTFLQSVSRRRWLAVKLGVLAGAAAVLGGINGAAVSWSRAQFRSMYGGSPFGDSGTFGQSGAVPAATWVFALLAGVTAGLLLRRTMTAAAVTLIALPLIYVGLAQVRPHYLPPVQTYLSSASMLQGEPPPNTDRGWLFAVSYVDASGQVLSPGAAGKICADPANTAPSPECLDRTGMRQRITYHPASRYPLFQLIEMGLLLTASGLLAAVVYRQLTRRIV